MYEIKTDLAKAIVEVKIDGFWSLDHVDALARDLSQHVARIALTGKRQAMLYDYTDVVLQSQAVVGALQDLARCDAFKSRRVALYSAGRTGRLQATRVASAAGDRFALFDDRGAAMAWLGA